MPLGSYHLAPGSASRSNPHPCRKLANLPGSPIVWLTAEPGARLIPTRRGERVPPVSARMQDAFSTAMNDYSQGPAVHVSHAELMQLRGEFERTKVWVRRNQMQRFMKSFVAWVVAYVVMIA